MWYNAGISRKYTCIKIQFSFADEITLCVLAALWTGRVYACMPMRNAQSHQHQSPPRPSVRPARDGARHETHFPNGNQKLFSIWQHRHRSGRAAGAIFIEIDDEYFISVRIAAIIQWKCDGIKWPELCAACTLATLCASLYGSAYNKCDAIAFLPGLILVSAQRMNRQLTRSHPHNHYYIIKIIPAKKCGFFSHPSARAYFWRFFLALFARAESSSIRRTKALARIFYSAWCTHDENVHYANAAMNRASMLK